MKQKLWTLNFFGLAVLAVSAFGRPARAAGTITVTSTADTNVADGVCTLREAIISINNNASHRGCTNTTGADTILLPAGTITLASTPPASTTRVRAIVGQGHNATFISGNDSDAVLGFQVSSGASLQFSNLTLKRFFYNALLVDADASGAIRYGKIVDTGSGTAIGACVHNHGTVDIAHSQLELCSGFMGPAIYNESGAIATMESSTVLKSEGEHGVIVNRGQMAIATSTIGANRTGSDAVVANLGGILTIWSSTLAFNAATDPIGAKHLSNGGGGGTLSVGNTVISSWVDVTSTQDCAGTITSNGGNAFNSGKGCHFAAWGDRTINDPRLQQLTTTENGFTNLPRVAGGVGRVYVPAANSPLVQQLPGNALFSDQRGVRRRPSNDIGAVQRGDALLVVGDHVNLSLGDQVVRNMMQDLGFTVTTVGDIATGPLGDNRSLVVISESVTSSNVNTKYRDTASGVLVLELAVFDDMNLTTAANLGVIDTAQVNLLAPTGPLNPLAAASGTFGTVNMTASTVSYGWGTPESSAAVYAQDVMTPSRKLAFYYPAGSTMANGFSAPGRRVGGCLTNAGTTVLTPAGQDLLRQMLVLAAGPTAF